MKKFLILLSLLFCGVAIAETLNVTWYNTDGTTYDTTTCTVGGPLTLPSTPTRYGYTFLGWRTYIPIEYIESTGTQYIDTGICITNHTIETKFVYTTNGQNDAAIFGVWNSAHITWYNNAWYWMYGTTERSFSGISPWTEQTLIFNDAQSNIVQNGDVKATTSGTPSCPHTMIIFARHRGSSLQCFSKARLYYFKIIDKSNNTLVRDFIPVRDINGVACMYDKVSNAFFYNAGTGNFIAGPAL